MPVAIASTLAVRLVLGGLSVSTQQQTQRTLRVALNVMLSNVKQVFEAATRLAQDGRLIDGLAGPTPSMGELLERRGDQLPVGVLEIADAAGRIVARRAVGQVRVPDAIAVGDGSDAVRRALGYERRVTIHEVELPNADRLLVVRAAVPMVDDTFQLRGALVLSVPLGAEFADRLKAELSADVVMYSGDRPVASSFVAHDGRRLEGFAAPRAALEVLTTGYTRTAEVEAYGRTLAVGFAPVLDLEGRRIGMFAVATDAGGLALAKAQAWRSLIAGGFAAFAIALVLGVLLSRAITRPLARLHAGARSVAQGDLDTAIRPESGDEIGELAEAFAQMTRAVRENQETLAARMREITTLHDIGRAVSSVLGLDDVLRRIVDQLTNVLSAHRTALLLDTDTGGSRIGAAVNVHDEMALRQLCQLLYWWDGPLLVRDLGSVPELRGAAEIAGMRGSVLAVPLEQKDAVLGLLLVNREDEPFSEPDLRLVATFADHAATAIQNARLYEAVQRSSEELERKVVERTAELTRANRDLAHALDELQQAQAQLLLSERMAGLGFLVAGIAHEINSPAGAILGAIDLMGENIAGLAGRARALEQLGLPPGDHERFLALVDDLTPRLAVAGVDSPAQVRRTARELAQRFAAAGVPDAEGPCRKLAEIGAASRAEELVDLAQRHGLAPLVGYLEQYVYLQRNVAAIRTAIRRISRIIGALKSYSHLDQAKIAPTDLHEGIENTLVILQHELRGIVVSRRLADLPPVQAFVDELNQVWTNLIHNAVQALGGKGEIAVESVLDGEHVEVTVEDNGPGIPPDVLPRIFEPFFTTKKRGEGTGLGLGIVRQIVDKHGGDVRVDSRPGRTRFTVRLPVAGPAVAPPADPADSAARGAGLPPPGASTVSA